MHKRGVFLTIPPFVRGSKFNRKDTLESCAIASVRIKVENAIRQIKEFKVFTYCLSNRINKRVKDDMVITVCVICHLNTRLINNM